MLFFRSDFEFAVFVTACLTGNLLHIMSLAGCPKETRADQALGYEANWGRVVIAVGAGRCMIDEKHIEVQAVKRNVARLNAKETG
jgi:hypothetical protein